MIKRRFKKLSNENETTVQNENNSTENISKKKNIKNHIFMQIISFICLCGARKKFISFL